MSKDVKSPKYHGVYWRELKNGDKQYFLRMRRFGRVFRIPVGRHQKGVMRIFVRLNIELIQKVKDF